MNKTPLETPEARLNLQPLDWFGVALLFLTLLLAPLTAGHFPNTMSGIGIGIEEQIGVPFAWILPALAILVVVLREVRRPVAVGTVFGVREGTLLLLAWSLLSMLMSGSRFFCWNALLTLFAGVAICCEIGRAHV